MRVEVQELTEVEKLLKVEVPYEEVKKILEEITQDFKRKAKIKGFREGKAPIYLIKKLFKEEIEEKSIERIIEKTLPNAMEKVKLEPLLTPKLEEYGELKEGEVFNYSVLVEVRPLIDLKKEDYLGLEIEREKEEVKDEEVEGLLREFTYSFSELEEVGEEEAIKERYVGVLKFEAFEGENPIPGHSAEALFVDIGTGEFNKKIEEELIGKKRGEKLSIEVEYPEEGLNPLLAGKKVRYEIEIKEVYRRKIEELTDEFLKKLKLGFESVEELRNRVKARLIEERKRKVENAFRERLLDKILEKVEIKVPHRLVELKFNHLVDKIKEALESEGFSFEKLNLASEKLRERLWPIAEKQAKEELLLERIAELENIEVSQEEIEREAEMIAKGLKLSLEKARSIVYFNILPKKLAEKTLRFLIDHSKPIYKEGEG
ncbi:MAG: trigger factor [Thermodesulfobacteriaceae bacterium]|nr:trigger factor [Thermodesulfobacteriaceae bacterium]MCX8040994.1 trigger factor [Thermodesulfobacteriaceae bacterium]MDW8135555.1 trigger factor [Thermodesulfobacterium sp.]